VPHQHSTQSVHNAHRPGIGSECRHRRQRNEQELATYLCFIRRRRSASVKKSRGQQTRAKGKKPIWAQGQYHATHSYACRASSPWREHTCQLPFVCFLFQTLYDDSFAVELIQVDEAERACVSKKTSNTHTHGSERHIWRSLVLCFQRCHCSAQTLDSYVRARISI
jgi:hypothetical protein